MNLTARQIELVQESWSTVMLNTKDAGLIFYNQLFTLDPSLRSLFKGDIKSQSALLIGMISFAVNKLDTLGDILQDVKALGRRHNKYNVKPEHYKTVAEALLWTLCKALDSKWTEETEVAWVAVYTVLSNTMLEASAEI
jgi:hemoglobin-like flavoprotein